MELADFHGRERVAHLPRPLDLAGAPTGTTAQPGDVAHYAQWDNMALSYGKQPHAAGLVLLGRLDDPAARVLADLPDAATAILEFAQRHVFRSWPASCSRPGCGSARPLV